MSETPRSAKLWLAGICGFVAGWVAWKLLLMTESREYRPVFPVAAVFLSLEFEEECAVIRYSITNNSNISVDMAKLELELNRAGRLIEEVALVSISVVPPGETVLSSSKVCDRMQAGLLKDYSLCIENTNQNENISIILKVANAIGKE